VETLKSRELSDFLEVAGLNSYDPATITRIYAGHPQRLLRRLWQTLVPIALLLLGVLSDKISGRLKNAVVARQRAKQASNLLAELGPAFIKAGQALSTGQTLFHRYYLRNYRGFRINYQHFLAILLGPVSLKILALRFMSYLAALNRNQFRLHR